MKQKTEKAQLKSLVRKASKLMNPISLLSSEELLVLKGELSDGLQVSSCFGTHVGDELFAWVFGVFERNMRDLYTQSDWGWQPEEKKQELQATTSRYLIVRERGAGEKGAPIAYCHFRFDMDDGEPVLYLYEIQIEPSHQQRGIGTWILQILESLAKKSRMSKVMCTVFKFNAPSQLFFEHRGYFLDHTSPDDQEMRDYVILSKMM